MTKNVIVFILFGCEGENQWKLKYSSGCWSEGVKTTWVPACVSRRRISDKKKYSITYMTAATTFTLAENSREINSFSTSILLPQQAYLSSLACKMWKYYWVLSPCTSLPTLYTASIGSPSTDFLSRTGCCIIVIVTGSTWTEEDPSQPWTIDLFAW